MMDEFSNEFERTFLALLSRRYHTRRVHCNIVYNEYIQDKEHLHMNATMWPSLTEFVKYLGKTGKCVIDETEKGWYIQWIDRDPRSVRGARLLVRGCPLSNALCPLSLVFLQVARQEAAAKRKRAELDDEERSARDIAAQVEAARRAAEARGESVDAPPAAELKRDEGSAPIKLSLKRKVPSGPAAAVGGAGGPAASSDSGTTSKPPAADAGSAPAAAGAGSGASSGSGGNAGNSFEFHADDVPVTQAPSRKRKSALTDLVDDERRRVTATAERRRKDYWLAKGIIVKIMSKRVGKGRYYKTKASVLKVIDRYVGQLEAHIDGAHLKVDQAELETVIPRIGGRCLFVNGMHVGEQAELLALDVDAFSAKLRLLTGPSRGLVVTGVDYADFCKVDRDMIKEPPSR